MSFKATNWATEQTTGSCQTKLILIYLSDHHNKDTGLCCPSVKTLANEAEVSIATANRALKKLSADGFIEIIHCFRDDGGQTSNKYRLIGVTDPLSHSDRPPPVTQIDHKPVSKEPVIKPKDITPKPPSIEVPEFVEIAVWQEYVQHRIEIKKKLTPIAGKRLIAKLTAWHEQGKDVNKIIGDSIASGWTGVFDSGSKGNGISKGEARAMRTRQMLDSIDGVFGHA